MSIPKLGSSESMVLKRGRVNGRRGRERTCGGVGRGRRSGDAWRVILYLIKAGLLPVRCILYLIKAGLLPVRFILYLRESRAPARSVQAVHRKSGGPVAEGEAEGV